MRGYAKIKENNPFSQRSKSKKENPFLNHDFNDHQTFDKFSSNQKTQEKNDQKPSICNTNKNTKNNLSQGKTQVYDDDDDDDDDDGKEVKKGAVLRRNKTISSSSATSFGYQKSGIIERQSSKRVIQDAVRRAFSMRSSSVNNSNSDRYSRIYDQPRNVDDDLCDNNYNYNNNYDYFHDCDGNNDGEDDGSMERRSVGVKKMNKNEYFNNKNNGKNNGKMHVGSKVVKACKRIFSL
ncbi:hypothetical protein RND81_01G122600 [Saponaria officinalis]|uniref:Uncharacterized protein n=1 Tax=Saponaria officinalis TaxID=3572 RepID=A0AAW1N9L8_SAPOF